MDDMVTAMATMMAGHPATLLTVGKPNLWEAVLAPSYTVTEWLSAADPDYRRLMLTIASRYDLPVEAGEALRDRFHLSEFFVSMGSEGKSVDRVDARGLGAAYLLEGIGVSLRSEDRWHDIRIQLKHLWLAENGQEKTADVEVLNLSESSQAERLSDLLLERSRQGLRGVPAALAEKKSDCFPHLTFGRDVDSQLDEIPRRILRVVIGKLITLDHASRTWRRNLAMAFPDLPKCNPESEQTKQQFGDQRRFRDPNGEVAEYKRHTMVGSAYRIHLRVIDNPRGIEIGYIGRHLDTKRYH